MITLSPAENVPQRVRDAIDQANALLSGEELYTIIRERPTRFDKSTPDTLMPPEVATAFQNLTETFTVLMDHFGKPSTTGAYTCSRNATTRRTVRVSDRPNHVDNPMPVLVATLIHECVHALDCFTPTFRIRHGDNGRPGNGETAPYWIGDQAGALIEASEGLVATPFTYEVEVEYQDEPVKVDSVEE